MNNTYIFYVLLHMYQLLFTNDRKFQIQKIKVTFEYDLRLVTQSSFSLTTMLVVGKSNINYHPYECYLCWLLFSSQLRKEKCYHFRLHFSCLFFCFSLTEDWTELLPLFLHNTYVCVCVKSFLICKFYLTLKYDTADGNILFLWRDFSL